MRVSRRTWLVGRLVIAVVACTGMLSSCAVSSLEFRVDKRLSFVSPQARQKVALPLQVTWSMKDFSLTGLNGSSDSHHGAFGVFVDSQPMPPGKTLKWLFRGDAGCTSNPRCPDTRYLVDHDVYVTTADSVTLHSLPTQSSGVGDEQHYVTIVLLDGSGRRIGESNWYLPFRTARESSS